MYSQLTSLSFRAGSSDMVASSAPISSRLQWFASQNTHNAPVPTEETKFHRKARSPPSIVCRYLTQGVDVYHCDHWYVIGSAVFAVAVLIPR